MVKVKSTCMTAWNAILPVDWYKWLYILIKNITCDVLHPVIKYSHLYQLSHITWESHGYSQAQNLPDHRNESI